MNDYRSQNPDIYLTNELLEDKVLTTFLLEEKARESLTKIFSHAFTGKRKLFFNVLKETWLGNQPLTLEYILSKHESKVNALDLTTLWADPHNKMQPREFEWALSHLKELYFLRMSVSISRRISAASIESDINSVLKLSSAISRLHLGVFRDGSANVNHFTEAVRIINSSEEYIPFSFDRLFKSMGGWTRGDLSSIGGKSGHNKTTFTLYDAKESIKQGATRKLLYFSIDEPGEMIARRLIASELNVSYLEMRQKKVKLSEKEVSVAIEKIFGDRLIIIDDEFTADRIMQAILDIKPDRSIIDHIQELDYGEEGISDQRLMVAAKKFKEAAKLTRSNVTIISQVRDKLIDERFEDKIPRPHDFLYASDLRRKSREQAVVYWEYKDAQAEQRDAVMHWFDFIIYKSTYSETGKMRLRIDPDKCSFYEPSLRQETGVEDKPSRSALEAHSRVGDIWEKLDSV